MVRAYPKGNRAEIPLRYAVTASPDQLDLSFERLNLVKVCITNMHAKEPDIQWYQKLRFDKLNEIPYL